MDLRNELAPLMNTAVVVVSLTYGLAHTFAAFLAIAGTLGVAIGLALRIIVWLSTLRYAYTVLRRIAQGHRELETPDANALNPFAEIPLVVHFALFPVAIGVLVGLEGTPGAVGWSAAAVLVAAFPASAAVMAITDNFAKALSPWHLGQLVAGLAGGYAKLLAFCAGGAAVLWLVRALPWPVLLEVLLANTLDVWAFLGVFALTGALIREHRDEFGIPGEVESAEERDARERRHAWRLELDRAYASIRGGLVREGHAVIDALLESEGRSLVVYEWIFDTMMGWEFKAPALEIGRDYVECLLEAGDKHDALDVFARCRRHSERFTLAPAAARGLAEYARSIGRTALAEDLEADAAAAPANG